LGHRQRDGVGARIRVNVGCVTTGGGVTIAKVPLKIVARPALPVHPLGVEGDLLAGRNDFGRELDRVLGRRLRVAGSGEQEQGYQGGNETATEHFRTSYPELILRF
jgi:hypothetical protein